MVNLHLIRTKYTVQIKHIRAYHRKGCSAPIEWNQVNSFMGKEGPKRAGCQWMSRELIERNYWSWRLGIWKSPLDAVNS